MGADRGAAEPGGAVDAASLVALGAVARAHGLAGELKVRLYNPESDTLARVAEVTLRKRDGTQASVRVLEVRGGGAGVTTRIVRLAGIGSREEAEALRGAELCVPRAALPDVEEGEHYHLDLVGLRAIDEHGREIGTVVEVIAYPSVDALVVEDAATAREIPFVEAFVDRVDLGARVVHVRETDELTTSRRTGR